MMFKSIPENLYHKVQRSWGVEWSEKGINCLRQVYTPLPGCHQYHESQFANFYRHITQGK